MSRRLKILLSAYACEPGKGSEPEAGWQWATRLARWHDVTVITRSNNESPIRAGLAGMPEPHPRFVFLDLPQVLRRWKNQWLPIQLYYVMWQILVWRRMRSQLREFDLIHHVTFNAFRWPGVWWSAPCPVLLGPLGGGQTCPLGLLPLFGRGWPWEFCRSMFILLSKWNPFHRLNCRKAVCLLVANNDTVRRIPARYRGKVHRMLDAGIDESVVSIQPAMVKPDDTVRLIWVGALVKRKALHLALRALAIAAKRSLSLRLTVVGGGSEEQSLRRFATQLGIDRQVDWRGRLARHDVERMWAEHDVFLFTSVRDTSGYVVLEAMLAGLPVITLNHQGAAEMTTELTALRVKPSTITRTSADLAQAILKLAGDPALRERLGRAGRERVLGTYTWSQKAEQLNELYKMVCAKDDDAPVMMATR